MLAVHGFKSRSDVLLGLVSRPQSTVQGGTQRCELEVVDGETRGFTRYPMKQQQHFFVSFSTFLRFLLLLVKSGIFIWAVAVMLQGGHIKRWARWVVLGLVRRWKKCSKLWTRGVGCVYTTGVFVWTSVFPLLGAPVFAPVFYIDSSTCIKSLAVKP